MLEIVWLIRTVNPAVKESVRVLAICCIAVLATFIIPGGNGMGILTPGIKVTGSKALMGNIIKDIASLNSADRPFKNWEMGCFI